MNTTQDITNILGLVERENFNWPSMVLDNWALKQPDALAIWWINHDMTRETKITYRELSRRSHRASLALYNLGIRRGDRVIIQLPRIVEWWDIVFGLHRIGAIPVPATSLLVKKDIQYRALACSAKAFIGDYDALQQIEGVAITSLKLRIMVSTENHKTANNLNEIIFWDVIIRDVNENMKWKGSNPGARDIVFIYFTSGTTGFPKMVVHNTVYLLGHAMSGKASRMKPGRLFYNLADLGWAKTAYSTYGTFNNGGTIFIQEMRGPFQVEGLIRVLNKYPITSLCAPPTIYRSLITKQSIKNLNKYPLHSLEHCFSAGEPLNAEVIRNWLKHTGLFIRDGYGQTETVMIAGYFDGTEVRFGSFGKAAPGIYLEVTDEEGSILPANTEGNICVRTDKGLGSACLFQGYAIKDHNGKLNVTRKEIRAKDGSTWYATGDRAMKDEDGYFWFVARADDIINTSGYRVGPFEVESALKEHEAVLESAAVGSPDHARGEIVKAFIVLSDDYKNYPDKGGLIEMLQKHCKKVTSPYKYPREIEFVEQLPKTISGKIRRVDLRQREIDRKKETKPKL